MSEENDITHDLDLLGDWLDAKGYTEEAGLCTRAMELIHRQAQDYERLNREIKDRYQELSTAGVAVEAFRAENEKLQRKLHDAIVKYQRLLMQYEPAKAAGLADATFKGDDNVG